MRKVLIFQDIAEATRKIPVGDKRLVRIGNRRICLMHTAAGFRAVADDCPHMSHSLSKGTLNPFGEIICPWHSFRFSIQTGEEAERRCADLQVYEVDLVGGLSVLLPD